MKKISEFLKSIPRYAYITSGVLLCTQFAAYYIPLFLSADVTRVLSTALDDRIPVIPAFVCIYVAAYPFWVICFLRGAALSKYSAKRLMIADISAKLVCVVCFCLFPCTLKRPELSSLRGFGAWALKVVYFFDKPTNLLPSMHCHLSWLCLRAYLSREGKAFSRTSRIFVAVFACLICVSTLFTKQHVCWDVLAGIAVADLAWLLASFILRKTKNAD